MLPVRYGPNQASEFMTIRVLLAASAALATAAIPAKAADLSRGGSYVTPAPVGGFNWSGAYVGVNFGHQWGTVTNFPASPAGLAGGGQVGYNWQTGQFVFGVETDLQATGADDTFAAYKFSNPWFGTARGRAGYAMNNILLYATAGLAYGGGKIEIAGLTDSRTHIGWTAGAGIEVGFTPNWSARAEYLYVDLNETSYVLTNTSSGIHSNLLRFGVNYRF
jgi:outer membrane immunogenic protein